MFANACSEAVVFIINSHTGDSFFLVQEVETEDGGELPLSLKRSGGSG